jgi:hypothetical protein
MVYKTIVRYQLIYNFDKCKHGTTKRKPFSCSLYVVRSLYTTNGFYLHCIDKYPVYYNVIICTLSQSVPCVLYGGYIYIVLTRSPICEIEDQMGSFHLTISFVSSIELMHRFSVKLMMY